MKSENWQQCLLNEDSKDVIKRMPSNSVDLILTDPPYNIGKHSTGNIPLPGRTPMNNDVADWDWVDFNPEEWADEFIRILKPTGNLFIFTSYNQIGRWYNCLDHKFDTTNFMVWHKTNPAPKIFKAGFLNSCEMIFVCWNKKHTWNFISQAEMHNFLESPICMRPERLGNPRHPAQKPISILKKILTIASNQGDIVFDPFMGVGSTGVAALNLGRKFIGVEINEQYFMAAKQRISNVVGQLSLSVEEMGKELSPQGGSGLQPIIKWAGGKEKELKYILPNLPSFNRYFEPFVGGGSVFMSLQAKEYYVNDLSSELMSLYRHIACRDNRFLEYLEAIENTWFNAKLFFEQSLFLVEIYVNYREKGVSKEKLRKQICSFCSDNEQNIINIMDERIPIKVNYLNAEMEKNLFRKMCRMRQLEEKKQLLPQKDLCDNIETAIKSAVYMSFRTMYNSKDIWEHNETFHTALFFFIRNYCYSGMFRYNDNGEFNVPYGGIGYNAKSMRKKIDYYKSASLLRHFRDAKLYNLDFEEFLKQANLKEDDFIFLDPPYDSEFSTYAQNEFSRNDQERLASFLVNYCPAKWMMIIKNTDFIFDLYNKEGIQIKSFKKEYLVSFMNRNDKQVTHLLITNY